ncbi:hypothetical protein CEXT_261171 [Caerostris extrusa]|uniref:Uncharacterized protein n=1 Tax=Caerostris extrusa TaxID=172846 RepID=A0AAV4U0C5_CAEEX|nr:hypothetical protein CEXT_261171 [Caerostris extrusa]
MRSFPLAISVSRAARIFLLPHRAKVAPAASLRGLPKLEILFGHCASSISVAIIPTATKKPFRYSKLLHSCQDKSFCRQTVQAAPAYAHLVAKVHHFIFHSPSIFFLFVFASALSQPGPKSFPRKSYAGSNICMGKQKSTLMIIKLASQSSILESGLYWKVKETDTGEPCPLYRTQACVFQMNVL